jgi:hypothetical protein
MANIGVRAARTAMAVFQGERGLVAAISAAAREGDIAFAPFHRDQIRMMNIAPELAEKTAPVRYPLVHIYCERVNNQLREKFRRFSGKVQIVAEARVSQSHLDGMEQRSQILADAVTEVLDASRGDWGNGMFYTGGYEISYGMVKQGGKNYLQITKVSFEVDVSAD